MPTRIDDLFFMKPIDETQIRGRELHRRWLILVYATVLSVSLTSTACRKTEFRQKPAISTKTIWKTSVPETCLSSPMVSDLNGDGVEDILVGHGLEGQRGGLTAVDGKTGEHLWTTKTHDEVYSTTPLVDLTGDGVIDPLVGGRKYHNDIIALDGTNGNTIWSMKEINKETKFPKTNCNSPVRIDDRDKDGVDELLVVQSGGQDKTRPPALIHLVSGKTGKILWTKSLPDKLESYSVPSVVKKGGRIDSVIVTSGGETLPGHVFRLDFPSLEERWRFRPALKGVIGSPIVHRFEGMQRDDVIVSSFNGKTYRLHGETGAMLWEEGGEGYETYVSPALGRFNEDAGADVVAIVSYGTWPVYTTESLIKWIDGKTGKVIHEEKVGIFTASSPLVAELTGDDFDEVIVLSNPIKEQRYDTSMSNLVIFDGRTKERLVEHSYYGLVAGTPHLSDIDKDGVLDLIHTRWGVVQRTEISTSANPKLIWNQLRGPNGDGVLVEAE